ncbi:MAG: hypothetical protein AAB409_09935 [Gemmatimonadota bacterium]
MLSRALFRAASLVVLAVSAVACSRREAAQVPPPPVPVVTFTATDFAFQGPDTIPSGVVTLRLVNRGPSLHHVQMMQLGEGKTYDSLLAALRNPGPPPAWARLVAGPNPPAPGDSAEITQTLRPGNYAMICVIPNERGVPHIAMGMAKPLVVAPAAAGAAAPEPTAHVEVALSDYDFVLSAPLTAGTHTLKVTNAGPQPHEFFIARLDSGVTAQQLVDWVHGGMQGRPPALPLGGTTAFAAGDHTFVTLTLTPGDYALLCFLPDVGDGREHVAHGMVKQIRVS